MRLLQALVFSAVFSLVYAWVVVWILERREKKYGQGLPNFTDAFIAGAFSLIFAYLSNIIVIMRWPESTARFNVLLITVLAGFCLYRESMYKLAQKKADHRRRAEIRLLQIHISKDPANAAYFCRLAEVYERLGEKDQALEAARMAAKLEPTERNRCKIKQLDEEM
ncbi:MAG: tetratricopeptide repeat protein [Elusimicrobia bacterium]|nr:tetratricopeptide repeat protein [Elusimicrobiota bacterium]